MRGAHLGRAGSEASLRPRDHPRTGVSRQMTWLMQVFKARMSLVRPGPRGKGVAAGELRGRE